MAVKLSLKYVHDRSGLQPEYDEEVKNQNNLSPFHNNLRCRFVTN